MLRRLLVARSALCSSVKHLNAVQPRSKPSQSTLPIVFLRRSYANLPNNQEFRPVTAEESEGDTDDVPSIDDEKKRKILALEMEVMRQEGRKVPTPEKIKEENWQHLLKLRSRNQRRQYYLYLWNIEMSKESQRIKKEQKRIEVAKRKEELTQANAENDHLVYGLFHNTMFLRIYDSTMDHWHNNK